MMSGLTNQEIQNKVQQLFIDIGQLRAENARLREALAKYADHGNWDGRHTTAAQRDGDFAQDIWTEDYNGWETAEAALANETPTA